MSSIAELIADYQDKRLSLPGLFEALAARGALPDDALREEQALLDAMAADGRIEPTLARALAAKLRSLQPPSSAPPVVPDDEVTRVQVGSHAAAPPPAPTGEADATVVAPASRPPAADAPQATAVTGTQGTASSSSFNRASWE